MAKGKNTTPAPSAVGSNNTVGRRPVFESRARKPRPDGRVVGVDNSVWLYRTVPLGSIRDAKTTAEALNISGPLAHAFAELAGLATTRGINRALAKKKYREFHLVLTNYPKWYEAPASSPIKSDLNRWFQDLQVLDRRVMLGVRLAPSTGDGSAKGFLNSVEQTLFHGGVLESDYDKDFHQVSAAMDRAGLGTPTAADWAAVDGWWNLGDPRPVAELRHTDHIHFFSRRSAWEDAEDEGLLECEPWLDLPQHRAITFASLAEFDLGYTPVDDSKTWWATDLVNLGARVVSARGFIEPPTITRQELKTTRRKMRVDLEEGYQKGKDQARREEREQEINSIEAQYDIGKDDMPPTIVDLSVIVGLAGVYSDEEAIRVSAGTLYIMSNRQLQAWHETMICSGVRGNPHLHDVPATTLAYAGFSNLTRVGDPDGAFLGLTHDKQPVYMSPVAASSGDSAPLCLVGAATGSGKTVLLQWIAKQHGMMGTPTVIIDPKEGSDLRAAFMDVPGFQVRSFDDFISSDGGLDPLTLYPTPAEGIPLAADMLFNVNPWGNDDRRKYEAEIANAIRYGVEHGAQVTGQALAIAFKAGQVSREAIEPVFKVAATFPMFRATFGMQPPAEGSSLAKSNSITLFMRGNSPLTLPPMGRELAQDEMSSVMRQSVNLLRLLVRGSLIALSGRGGVLHMDEAWVLERATPQELNEVGRLARSMQVLPIFYTQTPTGPLKLGLKGYFSRGLIGHISDSDEAAAGLELFGAKRPSTHARVIAPDTLAGDQGANHNSLKALWTSRDPNTGKRTLLRGSEFMYGDLKQRFAATTVMMPAEFLEQASTTPEDVARRMRELQARSS
jgi:hypothetical protein